MHPTPASSPRRGSELLTPPPLPQKPRPKLLRWWGTATRLGTHTAADPPAAAATAVAVPVPAPAPSPLPPPVAAVESTATSSVLPRVGVLMLHVLQGRQINGGKDDRSGDLDGVPAAASSSSSSSNSRQKTSIEVIYGSQVFKSDFLPGSNPRYDFPVKLDIYDVTTDIVIRFYLKHSLKKNECVGMVVIPIAVLLNRKELWQAPSPTPAAPSSLASTKGLPRNSSGANLLTLTPSTHRAPDLGPTPAAMLTMPSDGLASDDDMFMQRAFSPQHSSSGQSSHSALPTAVPSLSNSSSSSSSASIGGTSSFAGFVPLRHTFSTLLSSLFTSRNFHFKEWLQIYPVNYDKAGTLWLHRFPAAEDTIIGSGMERPKKELGRVQVNIDLAFDKPLAYGYMEVDPRLKYEPDSIDQDVSLASLASPTQGQAQPSTAVVSPAPNHPLFLLPLEPAEFHKTVMKKNIKRIRRWLSAPHWLLVFTEVFLWEVPLLTFYFLVLWTYICFRMPLWQYPLFIVLTCFLTNVWIVKWELEEYLWIKTYQDDAAPSQFLGEGHWKKFKRYKGVVAKVSHVVGKTASTLEKISNMLNFSDLPLSVFTYAILFIFAALLSLLLFLVPGNILIFLIGASFFVKGGYITAHNTLQERFPEWLAPATADATPTQPKTGAAAAATLIIVPKSQQSNSTSIMASWTAKSEPSEPVVAAVPPVPDKPTSFKARVKAFLPAAKSFLVTVKAWVRLFVRFLKHLVRCLQYLYRRSPDYYELAHRILCERAIATASTSLPPSGYTVVQKDAAPANLKQKMLFGTSVDKRAPSPAASPAAGNSRRPSAIVQQSTLQPSQSFEMTPLQSSRSMFAQPISRSPVWVPPERTSSSSSTSSSTSVQRTLTLGVPSSAGLAQPLFFRSTSEGNIDSSAPFDLPHGMTPLTENGEVAVSTSRSQPPSAGNVVRQRQLQQRSASAASSSASSAAPSAEPMSPEYAPPIRWHS